MPTHRHATVTTPLSGDKELFLLSMHGREELGQPFVYELSLRAKSFDITAEDLLGKHVTIEVETGGDKRYFDGICTFFGFTGAYSDLEAAYHATLRPWFWLLTNSIGNAVHQDINIPDLVAQLFRLNGFTDVEPKEFSGYDKREFIVQYRESTFNFISRWLEHEGIYYYFKHEKNCHKLCLEDDSSNAKTVSKYETVQYMVPTKAGVYEVDHFEEWRESGRSISEVCAVDGYNFKKPRVNLHVAESVPQEKQAERICLEAPCTHLEPPVAERYAKLRADELRAGKQIFEGSGNVRGLYPGAKFTLSKHKRDSFNQEYLVISAQYVIDAGHYVAGAGKAAKQFRSTFRAIKADVPFRPSRRTPRPLAPGPESAVVVGAEGDEISTEKYGRIRVQFHWDKEHEKNEDSSCWMRVAQQWAGADYGFQFVPRVGQEVLVDFLNGNPDEPVVTGSVYNEDNQPPFALAKHRTQSGIRTRSSKNGSKDEYNELRFDDDKGHEEVNLQAQRDLRVKVKHDSNATVGHDASATIKNNLTVRVSEGDHDTFVSKGAMRAEVKDSLYGVSAKEIALSADDAITLRVGEVSIRVDKTSIALTVDKSAEIKLDLANLSILGTLVNINPPGVVPMGAAKLPDLLAKMSAPHEES